VSYDVFVAGDNYNYISKLKVLSAALKIKGERYVELGRQKRDTH